MDSGTYVSLPWNMDILHPLCKKPAKESLSEATLKQDSKDYFAMLPDECLFEIFRCLPRALDRSICACVCKRWLMLQSSMQRSEFNRFEPFRRVLKETLSGRMSNNAATSLGTMDQKHDYQKNFHDKPIVLDPIDIDIGGKGPIEKWGHEKQYKCPIGDLCRHLEGKKVSDIRLLAIAVGTGGCGDLGELSNRGSDSSRQITDAGLSAIGNGCPALKVLSLWGCSSITDKGVSSMAKGCSFLEKINLCNCPRVGDRGLEAIAQYCPRISTVNLEGHLQVGNKSLKAIGEQCCNLKSLSIIDCPLVNDEGIVSILSNSVNLTKLRLQDVKVTDLSLAAIGYYSRNMIELFLVNLQNVTEKGFWCLGSALGLQKLKSLSVTSCRGLTSTGFEAIGKGCPSLKQVFICNCDSLSDKGLVAFTQAVTALEILHIETCNFISRGGLVDAIAYCSGKLKVLTLIKCQNMREFGINSTPFPTCESLKRLSIQYCQGFQNGCLTQMGKAWPHLQHLDISGLSAVSDDDLLAMLESCKTSLIKVNLSGCIELTDRAVCLLANMCGKNLQTLNLDGCIKVTDQSLKVIAKSCPSLQELDMSNCGITDSGVISLVAARFEALQILSFSGCRKITDKCLPYIEKLGGTLIWLNLQHCSGLSQNTSELFRMHLWKCDILIS